MSLPQTGKLIFTLVLLLIPWSLILDSFIPGSFLMHELSAPTSKPNDFKRVVDPFCVRLLLLLIHRNICLYDHLVLTTNLVLDQWNKELCIRWINNIFDVTRLGCTDTMIKHKKGSRNKKSTNVGLNYILCYANVWNKDETKSKVIAIFAINIVILDSWGVVESFCS